MKRYGLGVRNRFGFTFRLNLKEQEEMQRLLDFYSNANPNIREPKDIMRIAFEQLAMATNQLKKKLKEEEQQANAQETSTSDPAFGTSEPADQPSAAQGAEGGSSADSSTDANPESAVGAG